MTVEVPFGFCIIQSREYQCLVGPDGTELARLDDKQDNNEEGQAHRRLVLLGIAKRAAKRYRKARDA